MKIANGPRPRSIQIFAAALLTLAFLNLVTGLLDLGMTGGALEAFAPQIEWSRDLTIVALFTQFTISLIPLVWIAVFAAQFARWIVLSFGILKLGWALWIQAASVWFGDGALGGMVEIALLCVILTSMFRPTASFWLAAQDEARRAAFPDKSGSA